MITNVIPSAPVSTRIYLWNVTNQVFQQVGLFSDSINNWTTPDEAAPCQVQLPPGLGFVLWVPSPYTDTLVGSVPQGSMTNFVAGTNKLSLLASKPPLSGTLTGDLGFPGIDGADAQTFSSASQSYSDACTRLPGYGWYDPAGLATTAGPVIGVAQPFFVRNPGPDTNWFQILNLLSLQKKSALATSAAAAEIRSLAVSVGTVTLNLSNPTGARFNVQFSPDGRSWTTVATQQSGTVWTGLLPGGVQGYFQLVNP